MTTTDIPKTSLPCRTVKSFTLSRRHFLVLADDHDQSVTCRLHQQLSSQVFQSLGNVSVYACLLRQNPRFPGNQRLLRSQQILNRHLETVTCFWVRDVSCAGPSGRSVRNIVRTPYT